MKLSIFTTVTNPGERQDNYHEALTCYRELADEVVVVNGGGQLTEYIDVKFVNRKWDTEFDWTFIGQQFQRGYNACSGDWVLHADLDFIFHENDFPAIRQTLEDNTHAPALSFWKYQFILPDRYNLKSRLVIAVNKKAFGDRIKFNSGGDLAQPSLDGKYIDPQDIPEARVPIWNYECLLKTKEQLLEDKGRMARAWQRHFDVYKLGGPDDESAYQAWLNMVLGRFHKPHQRIKLRDHPRYIQEAIKNLKPEQWGYNALGLLENNNYV